MPEIRSAYSGHVRHAITFSEETRTKQSFKDECDINNIMAKYQRTGLVEAVNQRQPQYGDVSAIDFRTAMETVANAQEMFEAMPSSTRKRFGNSPASFLEFVQDPGNRAEAIKLGLMKEDVVEAPVEPVEAPVEPVEAPVGAVSPDG